MHLSLRACTSLLGLPTRHHELGDINQQEVIRAQFWRLKSRSQQSWFLLGAPKENLFPICLPAHGLVR